LLSCNVQGGLELYNFNYNTGVVSNAQTLDNPFFSSYYGGAFSPDDSKVYASYSGVQQGAIYQFDLNNANPALSKLPAGNTFNGGTDMRLGPDGKIYFPSRIGFNADSGSNYMGCITFPDNPAASCDFRDSLSSLNFPTLSGVMIGLPNMVWLSEDVIGITAASMDTVICSWTGPVLLAVPSGFPAYEWDNGSTAHTRMVNQRGTYWVKRTGYCGEIRVDTFKLRGEDVAAPIIIQNNNLLSVTNPYSSYQWYKDGDIIPGATNATLPVTQAAWYSVMVANAWECKDSAGIAANVVTGIGDLTVLRSQIKVYPNPAIEQLYWASPVPVQAWLTNVTGQQLLQTDRQEMEIGKLSPGLYFLQIMDAEGRLIKTVKVVKQRTQ
jgi:hypothetical protein